MTDTNFYPLNIKKEKRELNEIFYGRLKEQS